MKVLLVEAKGVGGDCHYAFNLAQALSIAGCEVTYLSGLPFELEGFERRFSLATFRLTTIPGLLRAIRYGRSVRPDVIHYTGANNRPFFELLLFGLLSFGRGRRVYTCHRPAPPERKKFAEKFILPKLRLSDRIIVHSDRTAKEVKELYNIGSEKVCIIPHGDYRFFRDFPANPSIRAEIDAKLGSSKVVLAFGVIREYKGLPYLIQAVALLRKRGRDVKLMVVGKPIETWDKYEKLLQENGLQDEVYLKLDYVDMVDVPTYLSRPDVVALPYVSGSESGVLHLASAFERPIVATDIGGHRDGFAEGLVAELVPPRDPEAFASALERVLFSPIDSGIEDKRKVSRALRDWSRIAQMTIGTYSE